MQESCLTVDSPFMFLQLLPCLAISFIAVYGWRCWYMILRKILYSVFSESMDDFFNHLLIDDHHSFSVRFRNLFVIITLLGSLPILMGVLFIFLVRRIWDFYSYNYHILPVGYILTGPWTTPCIYWKPSWFFQANEGQSEFTSAFFCTAFFDFKSSR